MVVQSSQAGAMDGCPVKKSAADELKSELARGPLQGDYPLIKNATRAVRRALEDVLQAEEFGSIRGDFVGYEFIAYEPSA